MERHQIGAAARGDLGTTAMPMSAATIWPIASKLCRRARNADARRAGPRASKWAWSAIELIRPTKSRPTTR